MPFMAMIVVVIFRRRFKLRPQIGELRRRPLELELEAAELEMAGLLGEHDFEIIIIVRLRVEALDDGRQKNRRPIAGGDIALRPADVLIDKLLANPAARRAARSTHGNKTPTSHGSAPAQRQVK